MWADKLEALSKVVPRLISTLPSLRATHSRRSGIGFGVVVTNARGWSPSMSARKEGMRPSIQTRSGFFQVQTSSSHIDVLLPPRPQSGLSAPSKKILAPESLIMIFGLGLRV